jgi:hypothetical protein
MMKNTGPIDLGDQGLLGAPSTTKEKKPKFLYHSHTSRSHTNSCECDQSNVHEPSLHRDTTQTHIPSKTGNRLTHSNKTSQYWQRLYLMIHTRSQFKHRYKQMTNIFKRQTHLHTHNLHTQESHCNHTHSKIDAFTHRFRKTYTLKSKPLNTYKIRHV